MHQLFSSLSKVNPFSRKQIFSQYKLPQDPATNQQRIPVSKDNKKNDQILIRQLRFFKFNLCAVLDEKNQLIEKMKNFEQKIDNVHEFIAGFNQGEKDDSQDVRVRFKELCGGEVSNQLMGYMATHIQESIGKGKSVRPLYFLKSMILYRVMLNIGKELKYECECFRLGTMSNFNQSTTRANFTKSPQAAQDTILSYIQRILSQSSKSMQSKIRQANNWQKQRFLRQDDKAKACWKGLQQLYNPKQVELIHFEMLNVLQEFDRVMGELSKMLESHQVKYRKYQGVMDSMELMDRQMREMQQTIEGKDQLLKSLGQQPITTSQKKQQSLSPYHSAPTLQRLIQQQSTQQSSIQKNIKIYHINQKLFANYNTQTNLISYYQLRKNYGVKLSQLQKRIVTWREELEVLKEMTGMYSRIDGLVNRKVLGQGGSRNGGNRRFLTSVSSADSQIASLIANFQQIPTKKNLNLSSFKRSLLQHLKHRLDTDSSNIRMSLGSTFTPTPTKDSQILQRQHSFFRTLGQTPINSKKDYLLKHKNLIQEYTVFNRNIKTDKNVNQDRVRRYLWQFEVCEMIVRVVGRLRQVQRGEIGSGQFEEIIREHLGELEDKFKIKEQKDDSNIHQLLVNHIYDYQLMNKLLKSELWQQYIHHLNTIKLKSQQIAFDFTFSNSRNQKTKHLNQLITFTQKVVTLHYVKTVQNILGIFYDALFQGNLQLSFELYSFQFYFWETLCESVSAVYKGTGYTFTDDIKLIKSFDPDDFFSIPCLTLMLKYRVKVKNLQDIIFKILKKHYNKLGNFDQESLLVSIVCLTLFITYLNAAGYEPEDTRQKVIVLNRLRRFLTVEMMKLRYDKIYTMTMQSSSTLPPREIRMILGVEKYLTTKDPSQKLSSKMEFTQNCQKYLDMFEKQIKPLTINISPSFSSQRTLSKLWNLHSFEQWPAELQVAISDSKLSPLFLLAYMNELQINLQELIKIAESPQVTALKQSEGFLIKRIKKETFYLKKQLMKFKLLTSQGIWESFGKILAETLTEVQQSNSVNERVSKRQKLEELSSRARKVLLMAEKKNS